MGDTHTSVFEEGPTPDRAPATRKPSPRTEIALVHAMRSGLPDCDPAWREFYHRHGHRLLGFIRSLAGDLGPAACDDLLQETMIKIQKGLARYEHRREGGFHSWCLKIAQRVCLDARRLRAGCPAPNDLLSFEEMEERLADEGAADTIPVEQAPWEDDQVVPDQLRIFREAFALLNAVDQAVIHLRHLAPEPLTDALIALHVGKPASQIRMIRNKALQKLKRQCERLASGRRRTR
jgi:RNA polymerase sigma factor (sigma-70 family)